jgi:TPR repeat protein
MNTITSSLWPAAVIMLISAISSYAAPASDADQEIALLRKSAAQGNASAQFNLGNVYRLGRGSVAPDPVEAAKWYRKAAEQGHPYAQFSLGLALYTGDGVKKDIAEAITWYRRSAEGGADKAQFNLGNAYWNGKGAPQDFVEAAKWYRKAAEQGMAQSQLCLAECILKGYGQPVDTIEACAWLMLAQRSNETAKMMLQMVVMQSEMTDEQVEKVRHRAKALDAEIAARPAPRGWTR